MISFTLAARAQAAELRFSQLKERHAELITSHADLMKKVKLLFPHKMGTLDSFLQRALSLCRTRTR